ncbi:MAG: hypothetical protein FWJ59_02960 [Caldicoprobacter sp.]|jgi:hypothetical protein|uniref:hypothetical protein n=1 Tax=Caldicoprobacter sp. TaxID=2004500 RepID=UPI00396E44D7
MAINGVAENCASLFSLAAANIILETVKVPESMQKREGIQKQPLSFHIDVPIINSLTIA